MGIRDKLRAAWGNRQPAARLAKELVASMREAPSDEVAFQGGAKASGAQSKKGGAWYMQGDLDGWEDTNANEAMKAQAKASQARKG